MQTPLTTRMVDSRRCPRCSGPMFSDHDVHGDALSCLVCGEYVLTLHQRRPADQALHALGLMTRARLPGPITPNLELCDG